MSAVRLGVVLMSILACVPHAIAAEANCAVRAWVTDGDPHGLNVRHAPSAQSAVLARLKPEPSGERVVLSVVEARAGWLKIGAAHAGSTQVFADEGWVASALVATALKRDATAAPKANSATLRSEPALTGKTAGAVTAGEPLQLLGVQCGWVKVAKHGLSGWARSGQVCTAPAKECL